MHPRGQVCLTYVVFVCVLIITIHAETFLYNV